MFKQYDTVHTHFHIVHTQLGTFLTLFIFYDTVHTHFGTVHSMFTHFDTVHTHLVYRGVKLIN